MAQCARSTMIHPTCPALEVVLTRLGRNANNAREEVAEFRWLCWRKVGHVSHLNHLNPRRMAGDFGGRRLGSSFDNHFSRDLQSCK